MCLDTLPILCAVTMTPRRPLPNLGEAERIRLLYLRGLDADLKPLNLSPEERQAMTDNAQPKPEQPASPVPQPAAGAVLAQPHVQLLTALGVVAAAAIAASESGILPAWVASVGHAVVAVLAVFGIASPGIRRKA
jgi:hypothetical protein